MPYPHSDPRRYERLLEHTERYLGEVTHGEPADVLGYNRGFAIGFHRHPTVEMVSAVTTGVRFQEVEATLPQEFVCSAHFEQEHEAGYLAGVVAERIVRSGQGYEYGGGFVNAEPLIPGSEVIGLIAMRHPFAADGFDTFNDLAGDPALQYITLVPVMQAEFDFVRESVDGAAQLLTHWRNERTPILNIYRKSSLS